MPDYVFQRTTEALNSIKKSINGSNLLIIGMAYKKNVDDMRESPALVILDKLQKSGATTSYYDPYIAEIPTTREFPHLAGIQSTSWNEDSLSLFDAAIIVTAHDHIDYTTLMNEVEIVIDTRNALSEVEGKINQIWKA